MIPLLSDRKLSHLPIVTILLITANIIAFWYQFARFGSIDQSALMLGVIPTAVFHPSTAPAGGVAIPLRFITGLFTHGGLLHLGGNMIYLWVFGRDVEDDFGPLRFLWFYLVAGVLASIAFVAAFPGTTIPLVGASGAIAGVLGAYFLRFPTARIKTLFILIIFIRIIPVPAFIMLGLWFFLQFLSGIGNLTVGTAGHGGVAFIAHIAGFLIGITWTLLLMRKRYHAHRGW